MADWQIVSALKLGLAGLGAVLLAADGWARHSGRLVFVTRTRRYWLAALGLAAFLAWWDFGSVLSPRLHHHEFFHYYLGAKYHHELGYTRLYDCVALAEADRGHRDEVSRRWIRHLENDVVEPGRVALARAEADCRSRFSDERWASFHRDVGYFREQFPNERWQRLFVDHGFNASPVWTMTGGWLANRGEAPDSLLLNLARIDVMLLVILWGVIWLTFGWEAAAVALLWWGTNHLGRGYWVGGAFLRHDWLLLLVVSIAAVKQGYPLAGGAALGYATLLRVFPGWLALGYLLVEVWRAWRARSVHPSASFVHFVVGMALAVGVLVPVSGLMARGKVVDGDAWRGFVENSRKHLAQTSTNQVGLPVVVAFDPTTRYSEMRDLWVENPFDAWYAARAQTFARRAPVFWAIVVLFLVLLVRATAHAPSWVGLVLGAGALTIFFELSSYYYAFFLVFGLLWPLRAWVGAALCAVAAAGWIGAVAFDMNDEIHAAHSVLVLLFVLLVTFAFARGASPPALDRSPTAHPDPS